MEKGHNDRKMFQISALWNWCAAAILSLFLKPILSVLKMQVPVYTVFVRLFSALVAVFGYGYFQVSRDLDRNELVVKMGIIGKILVFLLIFIEGIRRKIHPLLILPGIVDLLFAVLFIDFLKGTARTERPEPEKIKGATI